MEHVACVTAALSFIERHLRDELAVDDIAAAAHYSPSHFHAIFGQVTGRTIADYVRGRRLACAALDLAFSRKRILDIAFEYRFESQEAFTRAFDRAYGVTPGAFRRVPEYTEVVARVGIHRTMAEIQRRLNAVEPNSSGSAQADAASANDHQRRLVLPDVPRVGFFAGGDKCPEDIAFPSCLATLLRYIGADYPWLPVHQHRTEWRLNGAFADLMLASGMAFGLLWRAGWHQDNADLMLIAEPRSVIAHAFAAAGYEYEIVEKTGAPGDAELFVTKIRRSLAAGHPVLAFGVIGPPECCLITGLDDHDATLIGWNYFQDDPAFADQVTFEPGGCFRKRDWLRDTISIITVGAPVDRPTGQSRIRGILEWGLSIARTPQVYGRYSGQAAYDAWAAQLLDDADFATDDVDQLRRQHRVHDVAVSNVAECRWYAHIALRELAKDPTLSPAFVAELLAAAERYDQQHTLMWQAWGLVGGNGDPQAHLRLADPAIRRQLAAVIGAAREQDDLAAEHLERALSL